MKKFLEKAQENGLAGRRSRRKDTTERVTGLSRKTSEEIVKWNQNDSPELPELGGGEDIRHPRPPFGGRGGEEVGAEEMLHERTTSKSEYLLPCQNFSQWPPSDKTGRGSLLNRPSCFPNDPTGQGTELK